MNIPILEMNAISKRFPGVIALDHVTFHLGNSEIHALLGENGAGKSTLMKILFGLLEPDAGEIYIKGEKVKVRSPKDARKYGIAMVHQHFMLVDTLTVLENIALSYNQGPLISSREIETKINEISRLYNLSVDQKSKIWQLSVGEQQRVEIIRALYGDADILILDEPTSVLTPLEVQELFQALRNIRRRGKSVIFITHKLDEAIAISDTITVLRKGRVTGVVKPNQTTKSELIRMMIGKDILETTIRNRRIGFHHSGIPLLEVHDLVVLNDKGLRALHGISFQLREGEILGVAGVAGNGQREIVEALLGIRPVHAGRITFLGKDVTNKKTKELLKMGMSFVPDNKIKEGIFPNLNLIENLIVMNYWDERFSSKFTLDYSSFAKITSNLLKDFNIIAPSFEAPAKHLSGGNLQKLLIARSALREPRLLIMNNPTAGLDVATVSVVHDWLMRMKNLKVGIFLASEDLDEIMRLSDRVIVLKEGKIAAQFEADFDPRDVALAIAAKPVTQMVT